MTPSGRRYEFWSNGYTEVIGWSGTGQPTKKRVHAPTTWTLLLYPSNPTEPHITKSFMNRGELMTYVESLE